MMSLGCRLSLRYLRSSVNRLHSSQYATEAQDGHQYNVSVDGQYTSPSMRTAMPGPKSKVIKNIKGGLSVYRGVICIVALLKFIFGESPRFHCMQLISRLGQ